VLKLKRDKLLSNFAFNFNLRRYIQAPADAGNLTEVLRRIRAPAAVDAGTSTEVGGSLTANTLTEIAA
jgi:hypothetical protein